MKTNEEDLINKAREGVLERYITIDKELVMNLIGDYGSLGMSRQHIIKAGGSSQFLKNILMYDSVADELRKHIISKYQGLLSRKELIWAKRVLVGVAKIAKIQAKIKPPAPVPKVIKIGVAAHTRANKGVSAYQRSKPQRWAKAQEMFIASRKGMPNKELVKQFNEKFGYRTKSSILTKKHRLLR